MEGYKQDINQIYNHSVVGYQDNNVMKEALQIFQANMLLTIAMDKGEMHTLPEQMVASFPNSQLLNTKRRL